MYPTGAILQPRRAWLYLRKESLVWFCDCGADRKRTYFRILLGSSDSRIDNPKCVVRVANWIREKCVHSFGESTSNLLSLQTQLSSKQAQRWKIALRTIFTVPWYTSQTPIRSRKNWMHGVSDVVVGFETLNTKRIKTRKLEKKIPECLKSVFEESRWVEDKRTDKRPPPPPLNKCLRSLDLLDTGVQNFQI